MTENNTEWETIDCPVCSGNQFTDLFKKNGEPFVRCQSCGLVLINPRPTFSQVLETYDDDYSRSYAKKADKKIKRSNRRVKLIQKDFINSGTWLDVGCSAGFVVKAANQAGYEGWGVDVEPWGVNYATETLGLKNLSTGSLEQQQYPDQFFDVISSLRCNRTRA